jgi:hypothetical protein
MVISRVMIPTLKNKHTQVDQAKAKINMLEIKTSEANHKGETRICFLKFTAH